MFCLGDMIDQNVVWHTEGGFYYELWHK